ncbi:MAG: transglutaminaseTgpA domain-containing protein, partial [Planctomycetota bacterium]
FLAVDIFKIFKIRGIMANIASIMILLLAMKDFLPGDSNGKLESVATLLVYLQTVLMFQEKKTRLNWQILILSFLQVVVAAIFSVGLEAGLLFLLYFFVVAIALLIQSIHSNQEDVRTLNSKQSERLTATAEGTDYRGSVPITFSLTKPTNKGTNVTVFSHLLFWLVISLVFTTTMFSLLPRNSRAWFAIPRIQVASHGFRKEVNLNEKNVIKQSGQVIFRAQVTRERDGQQIDLQVNPPYFRGMALSNLVIKDEHTTWEAPYDRVYSSLYQQPNVLDPRYDYAIQRIQLEPSADPLIYGVMPLYRFGRTPQQLSFCHEVSAFTRCRIGQSIAFAPFDYEVATLLDSRGQFAKCWPFEINMVTREALPMSFDPPQHRWLTLMDRARYPKIVEVGKKLFDENVKQGQGRIELFEELEKYFQFTGQFRYTLDFRDVERTAGTDATEDFFCNHKSGHCELFASALTLMLRSLDIPARVVIGFYGTESNPLTNESVVRARRAHAWVEAYLPPEECTRELFDTGQANAGGAWMRLDPTPLVSGDEPNAAEDGIELARTVWEDYVIGKDQDSTDDGVENSNSILAFLDSSDFRKWEDRLEKTRAFFQRPVVKYSLAGGMTFAIFLAFMKARNLFFRRKGQGRVSLRRLFANALSLISPALGDWVRPSEMTSPATLIYQEMSGLLAPFGLTRGDFQTHREFSVEVGKYFQSNQLGTSIQKSVESITRRFNLVRFGAIEMDSDLESAFDQDLAELKQDLEKAQEVRSTDEVHRSNDH